jgi:hippurate hydrolase
MLADGLFERFPCDEIYALHNAPEGPKGRIGARAGRAMAGADFFDIRITGRGAHGAHPHQGIDPTVIAVTLAQTMQTIVSRNTDPRHPAVVSITQIHAGSAYNVIPETAHMAGTVRCFDDGTRGLIRERIRKLASGIAASFSATIEVDIRDIFSVLENQEAHCRVVAEAAREVLGEQSLDPDPRPKMASEDFGDMLRVVPGAYFWLGQTPGPAVHNPGYLFDDGILAIGASLLARIVERQLAVT